MGRAANKLLIALALGARCAGSSFCDDPSFTLEWGDEFDGESLDLTKWSPVCTDISEDASCLPPFPTHSSSNGAECRSASCSASHVGVAAGNLVLTSARDQDNASAWVTGAVKTATKAAWTTDDGAYRVCISAKLPGGGASAGAGQGIWPAHWMMPADDPCDPDEGEMDIFEMVDGSGAAEATYHWQSGWPNETCAYPDGHEEIWGARDLGLGWAQRFHEFAVERSAGRIVFAVNGVVVANSSAYEPPAVGGAFRRRGARGMVAPLGAQGILEDSGAGGEAVPMAAATSADPAPVDDIKLWPIPFYLILNSAVGGGWPGEPDERTLSPTFQLVDYVRLVRAKK